MDLPAEHSTRTKPTKQAWNFWIDFATAAVFAAMVGSGILAKWILPPGSRGGSGFVWLGQGRHFWGDIHFWLGITMLALVIVHVWLHWNWVLKTWDRLLARLSSPLTWIIIIWLLMLIFAPLIIPRQFSESYLAEHEKQEEQANKSRPELQEIAEPQGEESPSAEIPHPEAGHDGSGG